MTSIEPPSVKGVQLDPAMRTRRMLGRLLLVVAGTCAGLGLGEIALRAVGFDDEMARRQTTFDPRYGTVREDSWIFDFEIDHAASEANLRGQRVPVDKAPGEIRMLFVGDSSTEGVLLPLRGTYPMQLQRILDEERPGHPVRTVNAGVFGMTTIDELRFLESRLLPLRPDVVVVGLFMANDINFNLGHTERLHRVEPASSPIREVVQRSALAHFLFVQALALNARHHILRADELANESSVTREIGLVDSRGFHMLSYPAGEVALYMREPSSLVDHAFEVLEEVLWRSAELGRQHGFEVRVLIIPTPSTVAGQLTLLHYPDIYGELRAMGIEITEEQFDVMGPTRRVLEICDELGIVCIDPTERMRRAGMEVFFADDEHPTERGHAVLARELADAYDRLVPP